MSEQITDQHQSRVSAMSGSNTGEQQQNRAVLYADGGFYNDRKAGGWGLHGYVYSATDLPTKGTGNPKAIPTAKGYVEDKADAEVVKILNYVDSFGGVPLARSNNHTELLAAKQAMAYALEKGLHHTTVYSDSQYVVEGINRYMNSWKQNGWTKRGGEEIANKEDWMAIDEMLTQFRDQKTDVYFAWIKGHNGSTGNEMADSWAGKGNSIGLNGLNSAYKFEETPEGYWKPKADYNRIFCHSKWYFTSLAEEERISKCGRHIYYTGDAGDDDPGKPHADSSNAIIYLKQPESVLEKLRQHFVESDTRQLGHLFIGALNNITNPSIYADIQRFGTYVFRKSKSSLSIGTSNKMPVVHHVNPTGLAFCNVDNIRALSSKLERFLDADKSIIVTDITDLLYEAVSKKAKVERKLRKEINSTTKFLDVAVNYNTGLARELRAMDEVPTKRAKVRLIVGSDILRRNSLAALAPTVKRVCVLTWPESDEVFRYATVIETEDDIGIWASMFGNFHLVK